jgi:hypothetical protein
VIGWECRAHGEMRRVCRITVNITEGVTGFGRPDVVQRMILNFIL